MLSTSASSAAREACRPASLRASSGASSAGVLPARSGARTSHRGMPSPGPGSARRIRTRVRQCERRRAAGGAARSPRDAPAHREAHHVRLFGAEMIEHAHEIGRERRELERAFVIVRIAVAARPRRPRDGAREKLELRGPVAAVAADAVQEEDRLAFAGERQREARRGTDEERFQATRLSRRRS